MAQVIVFSTDHTQQTDKNMQKQAGDVCTILEDGQHLGRAHLVDPEDWMSAMAHSHFFILNVPGKAKDFLYLTEPEVADAQLVSGEWVRGNMTAYRKTQIDMAALGDPAKLGGKRFVLGSKETLTAVVKTRPKALIGVR